MAIQRLGRLGRDRDNFLWRKRQTSRSLYNEVRLLNPRSSIRLLEILAGTQEIVFCNLRTVPLNNTGPYEGLSYHWAGDVIKDHVYVNGVSMPVRGNLHNALKYLRYPDRSRIIWADAICIDQERDEEGGEKTHQLPLMSRIYGQAQRTVAYIGREATGNGGTHILNAFVQQLLRSIEKLRRTTEWANALGDIAHYLSPDMREAYNIPHDDDIGWETLGHLVSRSWVKRMWVVQEAAVSREVVIQCGPYSFDLANIAEAFNLMWTLNVPVINTLSSHFKALLAARNKQKGEQERPLLSVVIRHWLSDCERKQDKIYALRGLATDIKPGMFGNEFNYNKSPDVVYTEFARDAIRLYGNLDILSALAPFHEDRSRALPSWVPDWRVFKDRTFLYRPPEPAPEPGPCTIKFKASGDSRTEPVFSDDGRRLQLQGHILDTITHVGDMRPGTRTAREAVSHFISWRNDIARCSTSTHYAPTSEPIIDVFYHTITMSNISAFLEDALPEYRTFDHSLLMLAARLHVPDNPYNEHTQVLVSPGVWEVVPSWMSIEKSVVTSASRPSVNRRMVRTEKGYLGLVHGQARIGDKIGIMKGGAMPLVIRRDGGGWMVVGDGYVHGVMMGEGFEEGKCEGFWIS